MNKTHLIYHGSDKIIEKHIFGYGNKKKDYGLGFYCTENMELAKEWGASDNKEGYANQYELQTDNLSILDLTEKNTTSFIG